MFVLSVEQSDFEWSSWYWAGQMKQPVRKPGQVKEPPASSYTYTLSWWMTETTMWTTIKVETMVVNYNDQMSYYSTTAKDIFCMVGESESVLNAEDVGANFPARIVTLCG